MPVVSRATLVPDEHAASAHTYNSKSSFVLSWWEMTGLPSSPIATDVYQPTEPSVSIAAFRTDRTARTATAVLQFQAAPSKRAT